mmetsp:Transcript_89059/g.256768  ORF Transcript_89059/g.256768 Transcript_89059/m.256768 type:complete len:278 (-) Transcript_89059:594-1427(-)
MPLPQRWHKNKKAPPEGFDVIEPTLEALEHELRDKIKESNTNKRKTESMWPVHQINWQKSRYVYDMYYTYGRISKQVYNYCLQQKLVDAALIAKWKKPGYERLCSTYVINPRNYKFGTTSICRVPWKDRSEESKQAQDPTTGCYGCASDGGARNIFGNKYGQYLAAVQIAREERQTKKMEEARKRANQRKDDDDDETDDSDEIDSEKEDEDSDYGPKPAAGIWAGSQQLQTQAVQMMRDNHDDDGDAETEDESENENEEDDDEHEEGPKPKKQKQNE